MVNVCKSVLNEKADDDVCDDKGGKIIWSRNLELDEMNADGQNKRNWIKIALSYNANTQQNT